jgi:hypothetical protein
MAQFIEGITAQPQYPNEDLTDTNAELAELLMGSSMLRESLHEATEIHSLSSRIGHMSISSITRDTYEQTQRVDAIDHGIRSFEALKALVIANTAYETPTVEATARALLLLKGIGFERHVDAAVDQFADRMPRTREVIQLSSRAVCGYFTDYALLGAALAWKFEKDAA